MRVWRWTWLVLAVLAAIFLAFAVVVAITVPGAVALLLLFPGLGFAAGSLILFEVNAAFDRKALAIFEAELAESDPA